MLPSMPVLFTRESQDAFANKFAPSTSFFNANLLSKPAINPEPPPKITKEPAKVAQKEPKTKGSAKKKEEPPTFNNNALETALVKSYYAKVQSRFSSNQSAHNNKFIQFQNILKTFDPSKETPVELYRKTEQLFGDEHKDILEDFLLFLKPGEAAEVGRFMDHFMMGQLNGFIELLHSSFYRKPTVLRKILRALATGLNSGSSDKMKTRVLPHLRSHPRLIQLFKSLFPDERPPESAYENNTDTIQENFLAADTGCDVWEYQEDADADNKRKLDAKAGLDSMYLHGRVFLQHGRLLRTASVTYPYSKEPYRVHARRLAPAHCHLSPPNSEDERGSPKRTNKSKAPPKKTKKQLKSPTKNVKDVNDNTKIKVCVSVVSSPKTPKSKAQSKKTCKEKDATNKKDKKSANQKKEEASKAKQAKIEAPEVRTVEIKNSSSSWTREEDKIMLQVLKGAANSELVFGRIGELLPHRSVSEIKERFCHVMSLLQQMAVGEVT